MKFYRLQYGHYELDEMQTYTSEDGGEGWEDAGEEIPDGLCACTSAAELIRNTVWGGGEGWEVVEFEGYKTVDIYDGCRAYPTKVVCYYTPAEFCSLYEAGEIE